MDGDDSVHYLPAASGDDARQQHEHERSGVAHTFSNVIISILGAGVLGLPYAFSRSGWLMGAGAVCLCGGICYYSMLLLVLCRQKLRSAGNDNIWSYGDLGFHAYGRSGQRTVDIFVLLSQGGCCVSYLLFIGQNLASIFRLPWASKPAFILLLAPFQVLLAWVRSLAGLAPFSILADVTNLIAMAIVIGDDWATPGKFSQIEPFTTFQTVPFALGVACYCFEGFSMTLPLEASMKDPRQFPKTLGFAMFCITALYVCFGISGYVAFGNKTEEIITLNLPNDWTTIGVKLGLCFGLFFTFPVMLHPVYEIFERWLLGSMWFKKTVEPNLYMEIVFKALRMAVVLLAAVTAVYVPGFATFCGFLGASVCAMLAFVLPSVIHMRIFWADLGKLVFTIDLFLVFFGVLFALYGTYDTIVGMYAEQPSSPVALSMASTPFMAMARM